MSYHFATAAALTHNASRWDRLRWETRATSSDRLRSAECGVAEALRELDADHGDGYTPARTFAGEVFSRLCEDPEEVTDSTHWADCAQRMVSEVEGFSTLREAIARDPDLAALATSEILTAVSGKLSKLVRSKEQDQEQEEQSNPGQGGQGDGAPSANPAPNREEAAMRAALRRAMAQAMETVTDAREALQGLSAGLESAPTPKEQEDAGRLQLMERLLQDASVRDVLRKAGKLQRLAASEAKRRAPGVGTVVGLERGADLGRVLPSQLARLAHPALRLLAQKDMAERALMQYRIQAHEPQGRGPIVLLVDESGSMEGAPSRWANATVIAAIRQGVTEKREVWIAYFDTAVIDAYHVDRAGDVHNCSRATAEDLGIFGAPKDLILSALRRQASGGTDFDRPLSWALEVLESHEDRADLIVVTDGQAPVSGVILERLEAIKARGARIFGLTLGAGDLAPIAALLDQVVKLDGMPEDQVAEAVARTVPVA